MTSIHARINLINDEMEQWARRSVQTPEHLAQAVRIAQEIRQRGVSEKIRDELRENAAQVGRNEPMLGGYYAYMADQCTAALRAERSLLHN
jgi:hypothetical protein